MNRSNEHQIPGTSNEPRIDDEDSMPDILYELFNDDRAYNEKMSLISKQIVQTTMPRAHLCGYKDFSELDLDLFRDIGVSGTHLAELMGYPTFQSMCLNAPEIMENFTWKRSRKEYCGRVTYDVYNFTPIITKELEPQYNAQMRGNKEGDDNRVEKFISEHRDKAEYPEDKELKFRMRICETLLHCRAYENHYLHHSALQKEHEKMHNEKLNSDTYRKYLPYKTDINVQRIMKERFFMEIAIRPTSNKTNIEFMLRQPLGFIDKCYIALKQVRDEYQLLMSQPQKRNVDSDDDGDFGRIKPRFRHS
ncbi:hypothetical protein M3Y94_00077600 [Aphelenchoides besseyi]|nr:hypothetical protein M3Y94_00077600 [Aphelenchoides besseyi]KAI6237818.1 hypothetical protein M3Y95_00304800 [Aphelenchoides besseyi]